MVAGVAKHMPINAAGYDVNLAGGTEIRPYQQAIVSADAIFGYLASRQELPDDSTADGIPNGDE